MKIRLLAVSLALLLTACGTSPSISSAPMPGSGFAAHQATEPTEPDPGAPALKPRSYSLEDMQVGRRVQKQLAKVGVTNSLQLLEAASRPGEREKLLAATGLTNEKLLELLHMADLMRVKGIGPAHARLLVGAGVSTVKDLARRNPILLQGSLDQVNGSERLNERTPGIEVVLAWVEAARELDRVIRY